MAKRSKAADAWETAQTDDWRAVFEEALAGDERAERRIAERFAHRLADAPSFDDLRAHYFDFAGTVGWNFLPGMPYRTTFNAIRADFDLDTADLHTALGLVTNPDPAAPRPAWVLLQCWALVRFLDERGGAGDLAKSAEMLADLSSVFGLVDPAILPALENLPTALRNLHRLRDEALSDLKRAGYVIGKGGEMVQKRRKAGRRPVVRRDRIKSVLRLLGDARHRQREAGPRVAESDRAFPLRGRGAVRTWRVVAELLVPFVPVTADDVKAVVDSGRPARAVEIAAGPGNRPFSPLGIQSCPPGRGECSGGAFKSRRD